MASFHVSTLFIIIIIHVVIGNGKYSSHVCMGGDSRLVPEPKEKHEYLCHFKNVCYSPKQSTFLYYSDEPQNEIIRTVQDVFEHQFADKYLWFNLKSVHPQIDIIKGPMPQSAPNISLIQDNTVMHYSLMYYAYNYLFIDHFYAMWRTLQYFDLYDYDKSRALFFGYQSRDKRRDYRYIHDGTMSSWDHKQLDPLIGLDFIQQVSPYIWKQKPLFLTFVDDPVVHNTLFDEVFEDITATDLVCFESIVIEMGYYFRHWELSYFIQLFTEKHHTSHVQGDEQKILILAQNNDDGRRHYTNDTDLEEIGRYLGKLFGVEVDIAYSMDIYVNMKLREQIEWIAQYTVVIHSGGDDSYIHWFMRENTALITMDYFEPSGGYTVHYDSDNIEFDPLKKTYYYYMTREDMEVVPSADTDRNRRFDSKNVYRYRLDPQRLAKYVYSALLWVEHWNEWDETFTKPLEIPHM
eukprot:57177_1